MAEQQQSDRLKKMGHLVGLTDDILDAGILVSLGALWYKISGGRFGTTQHAGDNNAPANIAPAQEDEGNFDVLLTVLQEAGSKGCIYAERIQGVHNTLLSIHHDYAKQFRNFFFSMSGIKPEDTFKRLQELFEKLCAEKDDDNSWDMLSQSSVFPIKRVLKLCDKIQVEVDKLHPIQMGYEESLKRACAIIAKRMIDDGRLQGTVLAHTEEKWNKGVDYINTKLQEWNSGQDAKNEAEKKKISPWWFMFGLWILIIVLIILVSISAKPEPKKPLKGLSDVVSQKTDKWIDSTASFISKSFPTESKEK